MAKSIVSFATNVSDDATFRLWGKTWSDNLTAMGFIKTTDTGQIDWTSVSRPGGATTSAGYEIRKFNDTLQSTKPVYVKIEYGSGSATTNTAIWITVAFNTDGAGGLSNNYNKSNDRIYLSSTLASATAYNWYFAGGSNWIGVFESATSSSNHRWFFLERMHDSDGDDNGDGVMLLCGSSVESSYCQAIPSSGGLPNATYFVAALPNLTYNSTATPSSTICDKKAYMQAVRFFGLGGSAVSKNIYSYWSTDFQSLYSTTITSWDGTSVTVFPTGKTLQGSSAYWTYPSSASIMISIRWED